MECQLLNNHFLECYISKNGHAAAGGTALVEAPRYSLKVHKVKSYKEIKASRV